MKNKKLSLLIAAVSLSALLAGAAGFAAQETETGTSQKTQAETEALPQKGDSVEITDESEVVVSEIPANVQEAALLAFAHAGVSEDDVTHLRTDKDTDDRIPKYEIEFTCDNLEYEYEIDADTGEIRSYQYEVQNERLLEPAADGPLTQEDAQALALEQVPDATEEDLYIESESDDGRTIYEGNIYYDRTEYEFEIDAESGTILSWQVQSVFD